MEANILLIENQKICTQCNEEKHFSDFYKCSENPDGYKYNCKKCCNIKARAHREKNYEKYRIQEREYYSKNIEKKKYQRKIWAEKNSEKQKKTRQEYIDSANTNKKVHATLILGNVRGRAKKTGVEFSITSADIIIPEFCPVLGIPLVYNRGLAKENSASIDRIDNSKGYIPGNVIIVSVLANRIKNSATSDQILSVGNFYKRLEGLNK